MDEKKLKTLATARAKGFKIEADLNPLSRMLTKLTEKMEHTNPKLAVGNESFYYRVW